eukprot:TRINITY_DN1494_c0_g1_i1.p1 TRINITY_DN1494_c0_g1~~TRINITY_DN1494_c0_g1_i1.p1  ORF type:complete len:813 (+),score=134.31 TRINITY_DN1494_c0_g1_i1:1345-3783(+)
MNKHTALKLVVLFTCFVVFFDSRRTRHKTSKDNQGCDASSGSILLLGAVQVNLQKQRVLYMQTPSRPVTRAHLRAVAAANFTVYGVAPWDIESHSMPSMDDVVRSVEELHRASRGHLVINTNSFPVCDPAEQSCTCSSAEIYKQMVLLAAECSGIHVMEVASNENLQEALSRVMCDTPFAHPQPCNAGEMMATLRGILSNCAFNCTEQAALHNGKLVEQKWEPKRCMLPSKADLGLARCFIDREVHFIGDEAARGMAEAVEMHFTGKPVDELVVIKNEYVIPGTRKTGAIHFTKAPSLLNRYFEPTEYALYTKTLDLVEATTHTVYSAGVHDAGQLWTPISRYLDEMIKVVSVLKKASKGQLIVHLMPYMRPATCTATKKFDAYREAVRMAAACNGVPVLDTYEVTRTMFHTLGQKHTDNERYHLLAAQLGSDVLLNNMCRQDFNLTVPEECDPEGAKKRWATVPEIHEYCEPPPSLSIRQALALAMNDTGSLDAEAPVCKMQNETFRGHILSTGVPSPDNAWARWQPLTCRLPTLTDFDLKKCLGSGHSLLFMGDSLTRMLAETLEDLLSSPPPTGKTRHFNYHGGRVAFRFAPSLLMRRLSPVFAPLSKMTLKEVAGANLTVYGAGAWDMGTHWMPINHYLDEMIRTVGVLKAKAQKRLVVNPMHFTSRNGCSDTQELCYTCNSPQKAAAYREAVRMAAACNGVPVLDTYDMTQLLYRTFGRTSTGDGLHYYPYMSRMETDVLMNYVCRQDFTLTVPEECDPEGAKKRWATVPEIHEYCGKEGTPEYKIVMKQLEELKKKENDSRADENL